MLFMSIKVLVVKQVDGIEAEDDTSASCNSLIIEKTRLLPLTSQLRACSLVLSILLVRLLCLSTQLRTDQNKTAKCTLPLCNRLSDRFSFEDLLVWNKRDYYQLR